MTLAESRRKWLIKEFEELFPELAKDVEKYGSWRNDNKTLGIYTKNHGILAFARGTLNIRNDWKLQTYKNYVKETDSHLKQASL